MTTLILYASLDQFLAVKQLLLALDPDVVIESLTQDTVVTEGVYYFVDLVYDDFVKTIDYSEYSHIVNLNQKYSVIDGEYSVIGI